eukprot:TRINITY_DN422_c0_g1_i3.p1 TRINITY_DN422_c0_g1~~TRINITY_DN422_c0_g1_i3.p1  ORF type:complete len:266 (+),score=17.83 TRINITY_DN422_c0_g1_i3:161-958(+)
MAHMDDGLSGARTIRILVMGDSGVGKSELMSAICAGDDVGTGCQAWVRVERGPHGGKEVFEFIELHGDSKYHKSVRGWPIFRTGHGIILVYDLTDDYSLFSLKQWYNSYREYEAEHGGVSKFSTPTHATSSRDHLKFDPYSEVRSRGSFRNREPSSPTSSYTPIPILIVGTRKDKVKYVATAPSRWRKLSRSILNFQKLMASILQQILFLPMPSFLLQDSASDVLEHFRSIQNVTFMEWSSVHPEEHIKELTEFLHSVADASHVL